MVRLSVRLNVSTSTELLARTCRPASQRSSVATAAAAEIFVVRQPQEQLVVRINNANSHYVTTPNYPIYDYNQLCECCRVSCLFVDALTVLTAASLPLSTRFLIGHDRGIAGYVPFLSASLYVSKRGAY